MRADTGILDFMAAWGAMPTCGDEEARMAVFAPRREKSRYRW
ncbi:MAG TPA: hypothetical protein VKY29_04235 [Cryomorphaceae bacterium]|nr:hypothetical protein [Cryomorphaceae bacterium]